jgi:DNA-binding response OmpR family regulator
MATVLAVDDEEDIRTIIKVNLERDGHRVLTAAGGEQALELVRNESPDVIVLDVMMPDTDGWEVLRQLKGEKGGSDIPVLMLTARTADEDRIRGGIEGAIRYLTKPFLPDMLVEEVAAALEGDREPVKRRAAQREALSQLARIEKGSLVADTSVRPHLTRLERAPEPEPEPPRVRAIREKLVDLSEKQRHLLAVLRATPSVSQAAGELDVSRSNVYASLRRISRKLGTQSVPELLALVREGDLLRDVG